jgi:hypothetical protein
MTFFSRFILAVTILATIGCGSTTVIRSTDSNVRIYVDGEYKGKGQVTHSDTKIIGSTTSVRFAKDGCEDQNFTFTRSEEFDVGACIGGAFVLVPFLWVQKYKPERTYEFECRKTSKAN